MSGTDQTTFKVVTVTVLAACLVRMLYFLEHLGSPFAVVPLLDGRYYVDYALALGGGAAELGEYLTFRPPLYPLFLSLFLGREGSAGGIILAMAGQHFLGAMTAGGVAWLGLRLAGDWRAGAAGGAIYTLAGVPLYFEGELLIEPFMLPLVVAALVVVAVAMRKEGWRSALLWLAAGVLTGLLAQSRPNALLVAGVFPLVALVSWRRGNGFKSLVPLWGLAGLLVIQFSFAAWASVYTERFMPLTTAGGINLYVGNNRTADGMIPRQGMSVTYSGGYRDSMEVFAEVEYRRRLEERGIEPSDDPAEVSRFWRREAMAEIGADPQRWAGLMARKLWLLTWNHEVPNNKSYSFIQAEESALLRWLPVRWWVLMALLPLGVWGAWRTGDRVLLLVIGGFLALYAVGIVLFFVNARFRLPLWPGMAVLAGCGVVPLCRLYKEKVYPPWGVTAAAVVLAGLSLIRVFPVAADDHARDYYFRSIAHYLQGDEERALEDARMSLQLDPGHPDALMALGNAAYAMGRHEEAAAAYQQYLDRNPDEPRGWNNLGASRERLGDLPGAYAAYRQALRIAPEHISALVNAALLEIRSGDLETARLRLEAAKAGAPRRPDVLVALALIRHADGAEEEAQRYMEDARRVAPVYTEELLRLLNEPLRPEAIRPAE